jgi:hypothetical protein
MVKITERKTRRDWAFFWKIAVQHENTDKITLVMDNLNTHIPGSLYEVFPPAKEKTLLDRLEFVYTPKNGIWLNIAEIELNVLTGKCLKRRMDNIEVVRKEVLAWQKFRNNKYSKVNWHFTTEDTMIKLSSLIRHLGIEPTLTTDLISR